jgi:hypothetical protein
LKKRFGSPFTAIIIKTVIRTGSRKVLIRNFGRVSTNRGPIQPRTPDCCVEKTPIRELIGMEEDNAPIVEEFEDYKPLGITKRLDRWAVMAAVGIVFRGLKVWKNWSTSGGSGVDKESEVQWPKAGEDEQGDTKGAKRWCDRSNEKGEFQNVNK